MHEGPGESPADSEPQMARKIGAKAARKLRARRDASGGVWFGLGMMGLIGWSVALPALLGAGLGMWLDHHFPGKHGWTLALMVGGLALGCFNAWHWVAQQDKAMHEDQDTDNE